MTVSSSRNRSASDEEPGLEEGFGSTSVSRTSNLYRFFSVTVSCNKLIKYPGVLWRQNLCNFELCTGSGSAPSSSHDLAEGEAALSRLDSCASQSDRPQFQ